jgi:hypothetical protein
MSSYFILSEPRSEHLIADGSETIKNTKYLPCVTGNQHYAGSRRSGYVSLQLHHDMREEEIIWWQFGCVIHVRLFKELVEEGFTGFISSPATVRFADGQTSNDYRELIVTGWVGMASVASGIHVIEQCNDCGMKRYSGFTNPDKIVDWSRWKGDDFFLVWPLPGWKLITQRLADWLLAHKVRSFNLSHFKDLNRFVNGFGYNPGQLSNYFPDALHRVE